MEIFAQGYTWDISQSGFGTKVKFTRSLDWDFDAQNIQTKGLLKSTPSFATMGTT